MAAVPEANAGLGSAINDAGRQVGAAFGIGVLGALANAGYTSGIADALSPLGHSEAAAAERSVAAALQAANGLGGSAGETLRRAADAAFMDGFGLAMFAGAVLLAAGSVMVLRWLPSHDVRAGSEPATSNPDRAAYGRGFAHGAADDVSSRQHQAIAPAAADCGGVGSIKARGSETR
jgi:hypothetical protein